MPVAIIYVRWHRYSISAIDSSANLENLFPVSLESAADEWEEGAGVGKTYNVTSCAC